jgi:hypothetical protein
MGIEPRGESDGDAAQSAGLARITTNEGEPNE